MVPHRIRLKRYNVLTARMYIVLPRYEPIFLYDNIHTNFAGQVHYRWFDKMQIMP